MADLLIDHPVVISLSVAWGEMDAFQHVNNVAYFRYFESARIAYFEKLGLLSEMERSGFGPILASTRCRYKLPLTYPDTLSVGARITRLEKDRFTMLYTIVSQRHQKVAAVGEGVLVAYNYLEKRKITIPRTVRQAISGLENQQLLDLSDDRAG